MSCRNRVLLTFTCIWVTACVDLTAVGDFAKESGLISSNKAMLDDTAAQTEAHGYDNSLSDPLAAEFKNRLAVTNHALAVLNDYMNVLAKLSGSNVGNVNSEFTTIETAFESIKITEPEVQSGLTASNALANVLLDAAVRRDIKKLITQSAEPVAQITTYLADQAQTTSNTYTQVIAFINQYWGTLSAPTEEDKEFCKRSHLCKPVYLLSARARDADIAVLNAKILEADAAVTAFTKIHKDNAALAGNVDHLNDKALVATLKQDEPDLLIAIHNLRAL